MKKVTVILTAIALSITMFSCSENDNKNIVKDSKVIDKNNQKEVSEPQMTVEQAAKLDFECAALLMDNYWDAFNGNKYSDIKDIYTKYYKQKEDIYRKYGVTKEGWDSQKYVYWAMDHKKELKAYRKAHPEYDLYTKYPHFNDAVVGLYKLDEEKWHSKK